VDTSAYITTLPRQSAERCISQHRAPSASSTRQTERTAAKDRLQVQHPPRPLLTMGVYESTRDLAWLSEMPSRSSCGTGGPGLEQKKVIPNII